LINQNKIKIWIDTATGCLVTNYRLMPYTIVIEFKSLCTEIYEVLMAMSVKMAVFWHLVSHGLVDSD
jgi:hypothetical protein